MRLVHQGQVFWRTGGAPTKDWSAAAKLEAPKGWITAINSETGAALWRYHTDSQALSGLVPTKSGLLFAGDAHGNLLVLDATNGSLLKRIDAGGALNNGLISYAVEGAQSPLQWRTRTPVTGALSIPHLVRIEFYDINNNQIIGANFMGTVGLDWQVGGFGNG